MDNHDRYDTDILRALQRIANSLEKIEKKAARPRTDHDFGFDCQSNKKGEKRMSNDTKSCWKDRSPFTSEDNKEAMTKAFELFSYCMAAGPCNNCAFSDWNTPGIECKIGWPNNWSLFDPNTK